MRKWQYGEKEEEEEDNSTGSDRELNFVLCLSSGTGSEKVSCILFPSFLLPRLCFHHHTDTLRHIELNTV